MSIHYLTRLITCVLIVTFFQASTTKAQTILTGTVRDPAGKPLEGILLEAETKTQPPASAFVISGADGGFTLTIAATPASDSLRLSARALGYAEQLVRLANRSQPVALTLRESATALKEVVVQGAPITRQGDTHHRAPLPWCKRRGPTRRNFLKPECITN